MKKLISAILTLALIFAVNTTAFASEANKALPAAESVETTEVFFGNTDAVRIGLPKKRGQHPCRQVIGVWHRKAIRQIYKSLESTGCIRTIITIPMVTAKYTLITVLEPTKALQHFTLVYMT